MIGKDSDRSKWRRFKLALLPCLIALAVVWAGGQVRWHYQRRDFLASVRAEMGKYVEIHPSEKPGDPGAPLVLRLFGEQGIAGLGFNFDLGTFDPNARQPEPTASESQLQRVERARRLFPEADVGWGGFYTVTHAPATSSASSNSAN